MIDFWRSLQISNIAISLAAITYLPTKRTSRIRLINVINFICRRINAYINGH